MFSGPLFAGFQLLVSVGALNASCLGGGREEFRCDILETPTMFDGATGAQSLLFSRVAPFREVYYDYGFMMTIISLITTPVIITLVIMIIIVIILHFFTIYCYYCYYYCC